MPTESNKFSWVTNGFNLLFNNKAVRRFFSIFSLSWTDSEESAISPMDGRFEAKKSLTALNKKETAFT
jgi:hypothetical protein